MDGLPARARIDPTGPGGEEPLVRILLVGMMGSGKTTIGRELARLTGWPYVDNDELLRLTTGRSPRELLATGGEAALRSGEQAVVERALSLSPPVIVGIAGGVVLDAAARRLLHRAGYVVWLRAGVETILSRLGPGDVRPFMEGNVRAWVERQATDRAPLYRETADVAVDVDGRPPTDIAKEILGGIPAVA